MDVRGGPPLRHLPQPPQLQVDVRPPPPEALHHDAAAEVLRVRPAQREPVAQAREAARGAARARDGVEGVGGAVAVAVAVAEIGHLVVAKGCEAVGPDVGEVGGGYAAAAVADADRDAGWGGGGWGVAVRGRGGGVEGGGVGGRVWRCGDCDFDGVALLAVFDGGAEGVLEEFGEDVFQVRGHVGEARVGLAVDENGGADAVFQLADLRDEGFALADGFGGAEGGVDDADGGG